MSKKYSKQKPLFGLEKLPPKAYRKALEVKVSELEIELGKSKSYIDELEYELNRLKGIPEEELAEERLKNLITPYSDKINKLEKQIESYQKETKSLVHKVVRLNQKLDDRNAKNS